MDYYYIMLQQKYGEGALRKTEYGIAAVTESDDCMIVLRLFTALTTDKSRIQKLVNLCNQLNLDLIHIEEVIEDFLTDF